MKAGMGVARIVDLAEVIQEAGIAAVKRCHEMAGGSDEIPIREEFVSSLLADRLWDRLADAGYRCNVLPESRYEKFVASQHPELAAATLVPEYGSQRVDLLLSFPDESRNVFLEIKLYDDGKDRNRVAADWPKLARLSKEPGIECYMVFFVTETERPSVLLEARILELEGKLGRSLSASKTQHSKSGSWRWCIATLKVAN